MKFFVPAQPGEGSSSSDESVYAALAEFAGRPVPSPERRIYSISYFNDGEWKATVGQSLIGRRRRQVRRDGKRVDVDVPLSDSAIVQAIFPGDPYLVVTDAWPLGTKRSAWVNPFMAGVPAEIQLFDPSAPGD